MSRKRLEERQMRFDGGLNTVSDVSALGVDQFRGSENARLVDYGGITKRNGSTVKADMSATIVDGMFVWYRDDGTVQVLGMSQSKLWTNDDLADASVAWVDQGTLSASGAVGVIPVFQKFKNAGGDIVYVAAGGFLNSWDGTTLDAAVTSVDVGVIRVHNQRLWGSGDTAFPNTLFYSALNDGDTLADTGSGGGEIIVRTFGDSRIVGLASVGTSLLIFHERGISRLTGFGQDDTTVEPQAVSADTGLIAPGSIVEVDGGVFFISDRGAYLATEGGVRRLGTPERPDPIQPLLISDTYASGVSSGLSIRGCFRRSTNEVVFLVPGYGAFVYHLVLGAWCGPWTGEWLSITCMVTGTMSDSAVERLVAGFDNGEVRFSDDPAARRDGVDVDVDDSGDAIEWSLDLRRFFMGDEATSKALRWGYLTALLPASSELVVSWETDERSSTYTLSAPVGSVWGNFTWGQFTWGRAGSKNFRIPMGANGYFVDVRLASDDDGKPVISRWMLEAFALGRR